MTTMSSFPVRSGLVTGGIALILSLLTIAFFTTIADHPLLAGLFVPLAFPVFVTIFAMGMADYSLSHMAPALIAVTVVWSLLWLLIGSFWGFAYQALSSKGRRLLVVGTVTLSIGLIVLWLVYSFFFAYSLDGF